MVFDAHLDQLSVDWLKWAAGDENVATIVNTFTPDRGVLVMHSKRGGAEAAGEKLIAENAGVVVLPMPARKVQLMLLLT